MAARRLTDGAAIAVRDKRSSNPSGYAIEQRTVPSKKPVSALERAGRVSDGPFADFSRNRPLFVRRQSSAVSVGHAFLSGLRLEDPESQDGSDCAERLRQIDASRKLLANDRSEGEVSSHVEQSTALV
jgi:hypothetical protein